MAIHPTTVRTLDRLESLSGGLPFTAAQLSAWSIPRSSLRRALAAGLVVRVRRGVFVVGRPAGGVATGAGGKLGVPENPDLIAMRAALLAVGPRAVVSHRSAAMLHRLPYVHPGQRPPPTLQLTNPGARGGRTPAGLVIAESGLPAHHTTTVDGVPCTTLARTAIDLARTLPLPHGLVVVDAALRFSIAHRLSDVGTLTAAVTDHRYLAPVHAELAEVLRFMFAWPGTVAARRTASLADPRSESPLESLSRGRFIDSNLPGVTPQKVVEGASGRSYRTDFAFEGTRTLGEADGWGKYLTGEDLRFEKVREDDLRAAGYTVVRWTWSEILFDHETVIRRLRLALDADASSPRRRPA